MSMRFCNTFKYFLILSVIIIAANCNFVHAGTVIVRNVSQLRKAVATANRLGGHTTILLRDGTYTLTRMLNIKKNASNVTIGSQSGNRENVIIQGDAMSSSANVTHIFLVQGSNFEIRDVTLQKCRFHIIHIMGNKNADYPTVRNCVLRDSYEQLLKVSGNNNSTSFTCDNGLVEECLFEYYEVRIYNMENEDGSHLLLDLDPFH